MPSFAQNLEKTLHAALDGARERRHEYATLEHLLLALIADEDAAEVMGACGVDLAELADTIDRIDVRTLDRDELMRWTAWQLEGAVALTLEPRAFVMDEPMAGLGPEGSVELTAILSDLRHEAPILLIEHDMDAVFALADRISVLVYGRIIATGSVDEIRNNPDVQSAYLGEDA